VLENLHSSTPFGVVHTVQLPRMVEAPYAIEQLMLRPFGINKRDLEVDFNQPFRPALVTDILECCATVINGMSPDRNLLWALTVGTRIEWLLRIIGMGAFNAALPMRCLNEQCGETVEVELTLDELLAIQSEPLDLITVDCGGQFLQLRKPSGLDQREWATQEFPNERAAVSAMVQALVVGEESRAESELPAIDDEWLLAIDRLMQDEDALVNFSLKVICPCCENTMNVEIDLQTLAIERLHQSQQRLLGTVHQLAKHYHWSEQEIFAVPAWRRLHYLKVLKKELG